MARPWGGAHPVENRAKSSLPVVCVLTGSETTAQRKTQRIYPGIAFLSYSGLPLSASTTMKTPMGTGPSFGVRPILLRSDESLEDAPWIPPRGPQPR